MAAVCESSMPGHNSVLADPAAAKALLDVIPADFATLNELDASGRRSVASVELIDEDYPDEPFRQFWDHFWNSLTCSYTEAIPRLRAEVMGTGDFYTDRQWHSTGIYTEVLHPAGVEKELLVPLPAPPGIARRRAFFVGRQALHRRRAPCGSPAPAAHHLGAAPPGPAHRHPAASTWKTSMPAIAAQRPCR